MLLIKTVYCSVLYSKLNRQQAVNFVVSTSPKIDLFLARHTPDKRFSLASTPDGHAWTLRLKRVTFKDQGLYECQVNTSPESISLILNVTVVSGRWL